MLASFLIGLLGPDADEFLKDIAHLHVIHALRRQINPVEPLYHLVEQILLSHARNLLPKGEPLHDLAHVSRKAVDVSVQIGGELIGVV